MSVNEIIDRLDPIQTHKPSDLLFRQLRQLIAEGVLKPGERLPSELEFVKRLNINRSQVRHALKQLEFYGVIVTKPQAGSFVAEIGTNTIEGLLANLMSFQHIDLESIIDTRKVLELHSVELAALRCTQSEVRELEEIHESICRGIAEGRRSLDEDIYFHLRIADHAHSPVLGSLITFIIPTVVNVLSKFGSTMGALDRVKRINRCHGMILEGIKGQDPDRAVEGMRRHMELIEVQIEEIKESREPEEIRAIIRG